ncbi:MAG: hypothetical protein IIA66_07405 [Planctomycetes bacterium]|nr:hypothetical protein [Planctomycetota bacterium]
MLQRVTRNETDQGPAIFIVVDGGKKYGPLTENGLIEWFQRPFHLLFDTTRNELFVHHHDRRDAQKISLGPHVERRELSSVLEILRVFAENPGKRFTQRIFLHYSSLHSIEPETFIKYVGRARSLIYDTGGQKRLILTDQGVDTSVSSTGCAYYATPDKIWRVVRYIPELSARFPS